MHPFAPPVLPASRYGGPERRSLRNNAVSWLGATLDELDYGLLLLADGTRLILANHAARAELDASHPLQLVNGELRTRRHRDAAALADALADATQRGFRKLLTLGENDRRVGLSIVPLASAPGEPASITLVLLGRRRVCETLSVHGFGRAHGLTTAESRVLAALCRGMQPSSIAAEIGVAISTIRTQISGIRQKTGAESIRALVGQVAVLPPLRGALRTTPDGVRSGPGLEALAA